MHVQEVFLCSFFAERSVLMEASVAIQSLPGVQDEDELCRIVDVVLVICGDVDHGIK